MLSRLVLPEEGFSLEFLTISGLHESDVSSVMAETAGDDGYVIQERIIVPPRLACEAARFSTLTAAPSRCNAPLISIGHSALPVQYSSVIARVRGRSTIEKYDSAIKISAEGMRLLFSAPIFSKSGASHEFNSAFNRIGEILSSSQMRESAIARTWLFMEDTLRDYELLNQTREQFYKRWFSSGNYIIPASTGIQSRIVGSPSLSIEFCSFSGDRVSMRQQFSPMQNEPTEYGKLFSRAVSVEFPNNSLIFISGTAPIDRTGATVHAGDFERQMTFTIEALSAILRGAGGDFTSVVQAIIYLKRSRDMDSCIRILDEAEFPRARALFHMDVDICRDDLLCEIEVTAILRQRRGKRYE